MSDDWRIRVELGETANAEALVGRLGVDLAEESQRLADELKGSLVRQQVVSPSQVQRMKHVELITELLLAINAGQPLNKKAKIDEIIRGAALDASDLREASVRLRRAVRLVEAAAVEGLRHQPAQTLLGEVGGVREAHPRAGEDAQPDPARLGRGQRLDVAE